jgi:uncharacterized protein (TIGR03083 family)
MSAIGADRFYSEIEGRTARFAEIVCGDLERPVPTCPGWTFRKLAAHVGRGHRWAGEIVARRSSEVIPMREVPDGSLPDDPARHADWLNAGAAKVVEAVRAAGPDPVWTFVGPRPAAFWARRRAHEIVVHLADAQLAIGADAGLPADLAVDGIDEWLGLVAGGAGGPAPKRPEGAEAGTGTGTGRSLHFHATDEGLDGAGEWQVRYTPSGIEVEHGHGKADVAVRGPADRLLLVLMGRLPPEDPAIDVFGDAALFTRWLDQTSF